jgi:superoxide dismutase, Cu-Zn family
MLVAVLALGAATVAFAGPGRDRGDDRPRGKARVHQHHHGARPGRHAVARLVDAGGEKVGRVWLRQRRDKVVVFARVRGVLAGYHGFHVHMTGKCEAPGFTSAGGHLNPGGGSHGDHAGDLPALLVNADGIGMLATVTDRFSLADLRDADGSALIVHELPDNYANIPDRYGEPDAETLSTGDAGSRIACGEVR